MNLQSADYTPRFILGEDADFKEWLVHLHYPRFACRVRQIDEDGEPFTGADKEDADASIFTFDGECFTSFVWIDEPDDDLDALLSSAADFVEAMCAS